MNTINELNQTIFNQVQAVKENCVLLIKQYLEVFEKGELSNLSTDDQWRLPISNERMVEEISEEGMTIVCEWDAGDVTKIPLNELGEDGNLSLDDLMGIAENLRAYRMMINIRNERAKKFKK